MSSRKALARAAEKSQGQTVLLELVSFCETQARAFLELNKCSLNA